MVSATFHILGLILLATIGFFSIKSVAILRDLTEAVLLATRSLFVYQYLHERDSDV